MQSVNIPNLFTSSSEDNLSLLVSTQPLSALKPVRLKYDYNYDEELNEEAKIFEGSLKYYTYGLFNNFKDAVISKKNCLVLTKTLPLKQVFKSKFEKLYLGTIAGCSFLKSKKGKILKRLNQQVYAGGAGENLLLNIVPISDNMAYLKTPQNEFLQIDPQYPYTVRLSEETLGENQLFRRKFEVSFSNNEITFKVQTSEGYRFLAHGVDNILRAIGLELNDTLVNSYRFDTELVSAPFIDHNFNAKVDEIKYFNDLVKFENRFNLFVKQAKEKPTNYLVSFSTNSIKEDNTVSINLANTKTNFSTSKTYSIE